MEGIVASIKLVDTFLSSGIECAVCIKCDGVGKDSFLRFVREGENVQITSIVAAYTVVGSYPYLSYGISDDLVDRLARQSSLLREVAHAVIAELVGNDAQWTG